MRREGVVPSFAPVLAGTESEGVALTSPLQTGPGEQVRTLAILNSPLQSQPQSRGTNDLSVCHRKHEKAHMLSGIQVSKSNTRTQTHTRAGASCDTSRPLLHPQTVSSPRPCNGLYIYIYVCKKN